MKKIRWNITAYVDDGDPIAHKEYQDVKTLNAPIGIKEVQKIRIGSWNYYDDTIPSTHTEGEDEGLSRIFINEIEYGKLKKDLQTLRELHVEDKKEIIKLKEQVKYYISLCELI